MSGKGKYEIIVLFPSELRAAAKAIAHARKNLSKSKGKEIGIAFIAMERALWHLTQPGADKKSLLLAAEPENMERACIE